MTLYDTKEDIFDAKITKIFTVQQTSSTKVCSMVQIIILSQKNYNFQLEMQFPNLALLSRHST